MKKVVFVGSGVLLLLLVGLGWWFSVPDVPHEVLRKKYAPTPSQFTRLPDGARVHFRDQGPKSAPVVVLLHGSNSSLHTWEGWVKAMTPKYRVVTVDLPGHGLTGKVPNDRYSYKAMVTFLHGFLKARGIKKFALGGNSMGGGVTWKYAVAYPEEVTHLILVDAVGVPRSAGKVPLAFRIAKTPVLRNIIRFITPRSLAEEGVKRCYADPGKVTQALVDRYYDLTLHPGNRAAMIKRFSGYHQVKTIPDFSNIRVPTLILWGAKDTLTPPGMAKLFVKHIKGAKLVMYKDLGHIPMEEAPARTAKDALAFLAPPAPAQPVRPKVPANKPVVTPPLK